MQAAGLSHVDMPVTSGSAWMGAETQTVLYCTVLYDNQQKLAA